MLKIQNKFYIFASQVTQILTNLLKRWKGCKSTLIIMNVIYQV